LRKQASQDKARESLKQLHTKKIADLTKELADLNSQKTQLLSEAEKNKGQGQSLQKLEADLKVSQKRSDRALHLAMDYQRAVEALIGEAARLEASAEKEVGNARGKEQQLEDLKRQLEAARSSTKAAEDAKAAAESKAAAEAKIAAEAKAAEAKAASEAKAAAAAKTAAETKAAADVKAAEAKAAEDVKAAEAKVATERAEGAKRRAEAAGPVVLGQVPSAATPAERPSKVARTEGTPPPAVKSKPVVKPVVAPAMPAAPSVTGSASIVPAVPAEGAAPGAASTERPTELIVDDDDMQAAGGAAE